MKTELTYIPTFTFNVLYAQQSTELIVLRDTLGPITAVCNSVGAKEMLPCRSRGVTRNMRAIGRDNRPPNRPTLIKCSLNPRLYLKMNITESFLLQVKFV